MSSPAFPDHLAWPHQLRKRFRVIAFDWDGTAVPDREDEAPLLARSLATLLRQGVRIGVITGTRLDTIRRQLVRLLPSEGLDNLYVLTHRGSEAWSFGGSGQPVLRFRYEATPAENEALDRIAEGCRRALARIGTGEGLVTRVISNRLNRRKIDLIPVEEWSEPRKSQAIELARAVRERLVRAGLSRGIPEVLSLARERARDEGLPGARITSDLKHVEVGLTDKSDAVRWLVREVAAPRATRSEEIAVFGDEFGTVGGIPGSDALMQIPELEEAAFCSVGLEPGGVPDGVLQMGGGPRRFLGFLDYQGELWRVGGTVFEGILGPTANPSWLIEQEGFDASREREMESLFSIGNGYMGVRGSTDLPIPTSQAELYLAGIYDRKAQGLAYSEPGFQADEDRPSPYSEIVPFPSPFRFRLRVDGKDLDPGSPEMKGHERILDMKKGLLFEVFYFLDPGGRSISLKSARAASLADRHLLLHEIEVRVDGADAGLDLDAAPDFADFPLRYPHLRVISDETDRSGVRLSVFETNSSLFRAAIAVARDHHLRVRAEPGQSVVMRSRVSVRTSRDEDAVPEEARASLAGRPWSAFDQEVASHRGEWRRFWDRADIRFAERPALTQANRFGLLQLRNAAPVSERVSVGARGLTGRSYEGHVFWDAEIFILPFYLHAVPAAARNLLLYRYHTLSGARARAREFGCDGACYAWESTVDGSDVTPSAIVLLQSRKKVPIYTGYEQIHVTADVAHAVALYWETTGDDAFMRDYGAEILAETARFWASRVTERGGAFHIESVIGPDEYHHEVDDDAYTNWMARRNLEQAEECLRWLGARHPERRAALAEKIGLAGEEPARWRAVADRLYVAGPDRGGVVEQFRGFFGLKDRSIDPGELLRAPVARLLDWEEVNRIKLIKQADVLMIPFLFPEAWPREIIEKNFRYYAPLTDHGSSLSPAVHAAIAARIGLASEADGYWEQAINLDLRNLMRNTPLGIHLGCMGCAWQALVFHFLGLRLGREGLVPERTGAAAHLPGGATDVLLARQPAERAAKGAA